eukprot:jgi/Astpho2/7973/Aster-x1472
MGVRTRSSGISPSVVEHAVHWALSELSLQGDASAARQQHMLGQTIKAAKAQRLTAEQYLQLVLSCVEPAVYARWTAIYQKGEGAMRRELQAQRMALLRKQRQQQEQEGHAADQQPQQAATVEQQEERPTPVEVVTGRPQPAEERTQPPPDSPMPLPVHVQPQIQAVAAQPRPEPARPAASVDDQTLAAHLQAQEMAAYLQRRPSVAERLRIRIGARPRQLQRAAAGGPPRQQSGRMHVPSTARHPRAAALRAAREKQERAASAPAQRPDRRGQDERCCICLDQPATAGLLHGSSIHKCCCRRCAAQLKTRHHPTCPVCRQPIERVVMAIYGAC